RPARESPLDLVLAPALLKGAKMDLVIEKATELGVRRVAPVVSRYTVGRGVRLERWRRLAVAAAEQCGRTSVPAIDAPLPLPELLRAPWPGLRLIAWEGERDVPLTALPAPAEAVVILVGPEGGFAEDEIAAARARGSERAPRSPRAAGRDRRHRRRGALPASLGRPVHSGRGALAFGADAAPPALRDGPACPGPGRQGHHLRLPPRGRAARARAAP